MRNYFRLLFASILFLTGYAPIHAAGGDANTLVLDKENHMLVAPQAADYQWEINGVRVHQTGRSLKIDAPGTYKVVMKSHNGQTKTSTISIGITAEGEVYTIYLIGDSTVSDYTSGYYPLTGWGQVIPFFFDSNVNFKNEAIGGRSAKSFYNDHWSPIRDSLKAGDFVFVQFGINDAKVDDTARYSDPFTTFQGYLTKFVTETREKEAFPVLVATLRRNAWNDTQPPTLYPAYHDYPVATRELAATLEVPLIDLDQLTIPLLEGMGPDYTGPFLYLVLDTGEYHNYPDGRTDNVHFQEMGAIEMAKLVVKSIQENPEDTITNRLIPHIKPMNEVTTSTNFPDGATITRTASYPEGVTITLKAKLNSGYDLLEWQDGTGNTVGVNDRYEFTMGTDPLSFIAVLDDNPTTDCSGEYNGTAYIDDCGVCVGGTTEIPPCNSETATATYKLTSVRSGLCIEEGEEITHESCTNEASQFWEIIKEGNDYTIKNTGSGKFLYSDTLLSGNKISTSEEALLWRMEKMGTDTFQFAPKDKPELILEVLGATREGQSLRLYDRNGGKNQAFTLWEMLPEDCSGYPCLSIEGSESFIPRYKIVPNPITDDATFAFEVKPENPITFELYNLQGKRLFYKPNVTEKHLNIGPELSKGMYLVKLSSGKHIQTIKLLKN